MGPLVLALAVEDDENFELEEEDEDADDVDDSVFLSEGLSTKEGSLTGPVEEKSLTMPLATTDVSDWESWDEAGLVPPGEDAGLETPVEDAGCHALAGGFSATFGLSLSGEATPNFLTGITGLRGVDGFPCWNILPTFTLPPVPPDSELSPSGLEFCLRLNCPGFCANGGRLSSWSC